MNISSAVIHALPDRIDAVRSHIAALPGVEIHAESADGRFVITVEDTRVTAAADVVVGLHRLDGVLSAAMVYQFCDDNGTIEEAPK